MNTGNARAVTAPNLPASDALHATCPDTALAKARQLADAGYFGEAWQACHAHINAHGASAQAFCLLGLLKEARREAGAAEMYRKALYLDPQHYPALLQMAVLSRKNGQPGHAQAYTLRAERVRAGL